MGTPRSQTISIRQLKVSDGEAFLASLLRIDASTPYMLYEPNERQWPVETAMTVIEQVNQIGTLLGAFDGNKVIGHLLLQGSPLLKIRHSAQIVIGIEPEYRHQGIGKALFKHAFIYAKEHQLTRLELSVLPENIAAKGLYTKLGFVEEGIRQAAVLQDGQLVDEIMMAKLLVD